MITSSTYKRTRNSGEELVDGRVTLLVLPQHLRNRELEVFLCDVLSPFANERMPASADTTDFGAGALTHLAGKGAEVDAALQ